MGRERHGSQYALPVVIDCHPCENSEMANKGAVSSTYILFADTLFTSVFGLYLSESSSH